MSNALAIAAVTASLRHLVEEAVRADVDADVGVTTLRPGSVSRAKESAGVGVYLYGVSPNAALRNEDLPTRTSTGVVRRRPRVALNLHYLLSFHGDDARLEPQRLLGSAVRALHAYPVLSRDRIRAAVAAGAETHGLLGADLADQVESVRFTPTHLTLEELSKLWSVFFQTPYALSVAYEASVVLIDAEIGVSPALPVRGGDVGAGATSGPLIQRVLVGSAFPAILPTSLLALEGTGLAGPGARVRILDAERAPREVSATRVVVALEDFGNDLRAGALGAQVVHDRPPKPPTGPALLPESNVAAFVLRPLVPLRDGGEADARVSDGRLVVPVRPRARAGQRVALLLNRMDAGEPEAISLSVRLVEDADALSFPLDGVPAGTYLLRVQVDGAESPLWMGRRRDALPTDDSVAVPDEWAGRYAAPRVVLSW